MIGRTRWRFREVTSTQDIAFELAAQGARSGTIVRADYQSAGRGRLGRTWEVPANTALTFSLLLRPGAPLHRLGSLSLETAYALCQSFADIGVSDVALKWPNDVLLGGRKASGILVQTRAMPDPVAVIGIGVNVNTSLSSLPLSATSLAHELSEPVDVEALFERILSSLDTMWNHWKPALAPARVNELERLLWLRDCQATVLDADREITGTILGLGRDGGLRMLIDKSERTIYAGEIRRGPRPSKPDYQP